MRKSDVRHRRAVRHAKLVSLGYRNYDDYLRSPHWRRLRIRYQADSTLPQACVCGETEQLQLHHTTYERIGAENLTDLLPLCAPCHALVHVLERRGDIDLDLAGLFDRHRATAYRQQLEQIADQRCAEVQDLATADAAYLGGLTLDELLIEAHRRGIDIASELRVIAHRIERMKHKLEAAQTRKRTAA